MSEKVVVTGSGGLIGSEASRFFLNEGMDVIGIDNNMRHYFFGEKGDTSANIRYLNKNFKNFKNLNIDIRNRQEVLDVFKSIDDKIKAIIHTAAQPSHDWAAKEPFTDFDVNANGTLNMLESYRLTHPEAVFVFTSTNKVYGDRPNFVNLVETQTRYDYAKEQKMLGVTFENGISEEMSIDDSKHSLFGASKVAADVICQEYGKYFGLPIGIFRGGCLTGPQHSSVELHGFLSYIVKCAATNTPYTIFGYKGKQVRDQIHSFDVVNAFWQFIQNPKQGEVYNLGGGKENAASVLEIIDILDKGYGLKLNYQYSDKNRAGDHICYYSDMSKFKNDYPAWSHTKSLSRILDEIVEKEKSQSEGGNLE